MDNLSAVILAAGEGKRMKSDIPKVIHSLCGIPLIEWVYKACKGAGIDDCFVVVGHKSEKVKECMKDKVSFAMQKERLGTGHAVMMTEEYLKNLDGDVIIISGDTPLITKDTIKTILKFHKDNHNAATVLTADFENPYGYGRVVRDKSSVIKIVEEKDATTGEKNIKEINSGIYCFKVKKLLSSLSKISNNNAQNEYYLPDTIEILINEGLKVAAYKIENRDEILGINSRQQLAVAESIMRQRINLHHMEEGVTIIDPNNAYIGGDVSIERDTIIYPGCYIEGDTAIGYGCEIGPNSRIKNCDIGENTVVQHSVLTNSKVGNNTNIGPFAYLRPGSNIGSKVKIGDFVEIKNSKIGDGTKISHLSYIGDAELGNSVNMGCGCVVVNYDGVNKHKTLVEDNAFIGCNVNLISPVKIGNNAYVAAGSTITDHVPDNSLAIARQRQTVKEDWNKNRRVTKE